MLAYQRNRKQPTASDDVIDRAAADAIEEMLGGEAWNHIEQRLAVQYDRSLAELLTSGTTADRTEFLRGHMEALTLMRELPSILVAEGRSKRQKVGE